MTKDETRLKDPPHFNSLYLEEIQEMEDRAKILLREAEAFMDLGKDKQALASQFIAKTYTATADALMERAISEPLAKA
jgi:hypothetical protein